MPDAVLNQVVTIGQVQVRVVILGPLPPGVTAEDRLAWVIAAAGRTPLPHLDDTCYVVTRSFADDRGEIFEAGEQIWADPDDPEAIYWAAGCLRPAEPGEYERQMPVLVVHAEAGPGGP